MLEFHTPEIRDKEWVDELLRISQFQGDEYCFGNMFMWGPVYQTKIARYKDFLLTMSDTGKGAYCCSAGQGDRAEVIRVLLEDARERGRPLRLFGLSQNCVQELERLMPGRFVFEAERDWFDYIYLTQDLIELAGKKYHGKRNHIAAFKRMYQWAYEPITPDNLAECWEMNARWEEKNSDKAEDGVADELIAIKRGFDHFFELGFVGGLLRVDGQVAAYTFGERLNHDTFCTHVEKAFSDMRGAYPMINQEFAAQALRDYRYVNREEDTGSEGLRKAKLSYYPVILYEKYVARYVG